MHTYTTTPKHTYTQMCAHPLSCDPVLMKTDTELRDIRQQFTFKATEDNVPTVESRQGETPPADSLFLQFYFVNMTQSHTTIKKPKPHTHTHTQAASHTHV